MKKRFALLIMAGILGTASAVFASTVKTPVDNPPTITEERVESNKLDDLRNERLKLHKERLDQHVKDGYMTQEEADSMYNRMENNQYFCNGWDDTNIGRRIEIDSGYRMRNKMNLGWGMGRGRGCW